MRWKGALQQQYMAEGSPSATLCSRKKPVSNILWQSRALQQHYVVEVSSSAALCGREESFSNIGWQKGALHQHQLGGGGGALQKYQLTEGPEVSTTMCDRDKPYCKIIGRKEPYSNIIWNSQQLHTLAARSPTATLIGRHEPYSTIFGQREALQLNLLGERSPKDK